MPGTPNVRTMDPAAKASSSVRPAVPDDAEAVRVLAAEVALTFAPDSAAFAASFAAVRAARHAHLLVVDIDEMVGGYLLGVEHPTFFANGPVGWIEELGVRADLRRHGLGAQLVRAFEERVRPRCRLVALATTRADTFYQAIGYQRRARYLRKLL